MDNAPKRKNYQNIGVSLFIGLFLISVGVFLFNSGAQHLKSKRDSRKWPIVQGQIVRTNVWGQMRPGDSIDDVILYQYIIDGRTYYSTRFAYWRIEGEAIRAEGEYNRDIYKGFVNHYPVGKSVAVYYNPDFYSDAVIIPGLDQTLDSNRGSGILAVLAGFLIVGMSIFSILRSRIGASPTHK